MAKFAHMGDCHLGSWRQPELQELNFKSFQTAIDKCIMEKVDFVLMAGDLFDSAYPPIEILKQTFAEFRKLKDAGIKVFMIAGSHDFSVSGKTFLDVLEKGGFCEICKYREEEMGGEKVIHLDALKYKNFEIFGYPGKKSGMEVEDIKKILLPKETNNYRILMLHTSITEAVGNLPIESVSLKRLPKADYYAFAHLHINFDEKVGEKGKEKPAIYSGPIFPNSFQELEDLCYGRFYIVQVEGFVEAKKIMLPIKEVICFNIDIDNALTATSKIIAEFDKHEIKDKIVLMRLSGTIKQGTNADIDYKRITDYLEQRGSYSFLKNTNKLQSSEEEIADVKITIGDMNKIEEVIIKQYELDNPDKFNELVLPLMHSLDLGKQEDEKTVIFETRLFADLNKILGLEMR
ncbi:MAG: DNA repair exonuclease, partial [Nanoarchaeota archaeon]